MSHRAFVPAGAALAVFALSTPASAEVFSGVVGGAEYEIHLPAAWNGDLVIYAHGVDDPDTTPEVDPDDFPFAVFESLGYAVALTSFSDTGWVVKEAKGEIQQLKGIAASVMGPAERVYMLGGSMGGLVAAQQVETFESQYDGALLFCPPLTGLIGEMGYLGDVTVLFDTFYPGVLGFDPVNPPADPDANLAIYAASLAMGADPTGLLQIASVMGGELAGTTPTELATSVLTAIGFWAVYAPDTRDRAGGWPIDTTGRVYAGSWDDAALNAGIARFSSSPQAVAYAEHHYDPDGGLPVPTIVLTTTEDPVVPLFNTIDYQARVAAAGASDLLAVQTVERYGHCALTGEEVFGAFSDLVAWVEFGLPPAP